jgi:positive regulator of sigma E activity
MYQNVYVSDVNFETGEVTVGCSSSACEGCHAGLFCNSKGQTFQVKNPNGLEIKKGDYVRIFLPPGKTIFSSVLLFALPLALFPVFYLIMPSSNEILRAVVGLGGSALGFLIAYLFFRKKKESLMPFIESKQKSPLEAKFEQAALEQEENRNV